MSERLTQTDQSGLLESGNLDYFERELGEPTNLGRALTIVGHPFAPPVSNQDLMEMAVEFGLPEDKIEAAQNAVDGTGFTTRHFSHDITQVPDFQVATERSAKIGSLLIKNIMDARDWDGIDVFIDASAFLSKEVNQMALDGAGLDPDQVISRSYRYACAGAIGAFIDTVSDPDIEPDARVVIAALEPLSLMINSDQFTDPKEIINPSIFGDSFTALAFTPSHFELSVKKILIKPDHGVIKIPTFYDFQGVIEDRNVPEYYTYAENGEEYFRYSEAGAFLDITPPDPGMPVSMDGKRTGIFFGENTTNVIIDLITEYGDLDLLNRLDGKNLIMHSASRPVVNYIAKRLSKIKDGLTYLNKPELPFYMDQAGHSNSSSATSLNRLRYMIDQNLINPENEVLWLAPGIGSAIAGAIGKIHL
jgi:hypothetical protein